VQLHHVTLFVRDAERSLRFYRDGLGFAVFVDREFDGDWPALFGVASKRLRAVILGDPKHPNAGGVELVTFAEAVPDGPPPTEPATGTAMLAFILDVEAVLPKLLAGGCHRGPPRDALERSCRGDGARSGRCPRRAARRRAQDELVVTGARRGRSRGSGCSRSATSWPVPTAECCSRISART
jgi:glyoxylase I family protein